MKYADLPSYLANASLYRVETLTDATPGQYPSGTRWLSAPDLIDRDCPTPECGMTKWERIGERYISEKGFHELEYRCRNCQKFIFRLWVGWWTHQGGVMFVKAGQYPKPEVVIPKEFERALGDKRDLYVKGMTSRHNGYGIGAMSYFRRVIEDTTDEMLDLLEGAMTETGADPAAVEQLKKAKEGIRFEDKVQIAAKVIPAHLRPGGVNPFGDLYALLSIGLHGLTDAECCDIVDGMDQSLKFIYTQLKTHVEDAKNYEAGVKAISETVARLKGRGTK